MLTVPSTGCQTLVTRAFLAGNRAVPEVVVAIVATRGYRKT
jgi:hypothetical protein